MDEKDFEIENILKEKIVKKKKINAKQKGNRGELDLCKLLTAHFGDEFSRAVGSGNRWSHVHHMPEHAKTTLAGDICVPENYLWVIECKCGYDKEIDLNGMFVSGLARLDAFIEQSERDEEFTGRKPIICWKRSRKPWLAMVKREHLEQDFEIMACYKSWKVVSLHELLEKTDRTFWFKGE